MLNKIHNTAIVDKKAKVGENVQIGPYSIIGPDVKIGDGTVIKSHVVIDGDTKIGRENIIFPFVVIGQDPQDLKYSGEKSQIIIGDNNKIREHTTIHPGTKDDNMITRIGNNCLFMVASHVAHDCVVGNNVILANNATLAGHVKVEDNVVIGGLSAVHQFVRIGKHAMIGGMSGIEHDVIPYSTVIGERASLAGLNLIGLKRAGFSREEIHALRKFYKELFQKDGNIVDKINSLKTEYKDRSLVNNVIDFLQINSSRGILQSKQSNS